MDPEKSDASQADASEPSEQNDSPAPAPASVADSRPPLEEQGKSKVAIIMTALCVAVFLAALDMSIVATALPSIAAEFQITQADFNWIGSAYLLGSAALTPPWGKVSDIFGRKPVLLAANVVFLVGSLLCGVAVNVRMLIAGRTIQGAGGGGLLALVNICIADLFSQRSRGLYYGLVGGTWAIAGAIGPLLGGVFAEFVTWRWCFYINLPLDGLALFILYFFLDIHTPTTPVLAGLAAIDWIGLVVSIAGIVLFLLGLESGGVTLPWSSPAVICLLVFGIVLMVLFFVIEAKVAKYPLIPLRLFTSRSNAFAFGTRFFHSFTFMAGAYFLPLYFQSVLDSSPFDAGVKQLAYILAISIPGMLVGFLIKKTGDFKSFICGGMFLMAVGFGLFINFPDYTNYARIIPAQIIAGIGTGPNFQAPLIAMQAHTDPADIATISSTYAFVGQCGSTISLVIAGAILQNRLHSYAGVLSQVLSPPDVAEIAGGSAGSSVHLIQSLPGPAKALVHQVYTASLQTMWIFFCVTATCGFLCSLFIKRKVLDKSHTVRKQGLETEEQNRLERLARQAELKAKGTGTKVETA